jgi:hypothetical protein
MKLKAALRLQYLRRRKLLMKVVTKSYLECICVEALNEVLRFRDVRAVKLSRPSFGTVNWTLREVEPRFDIRDVRTSHSVIRTLQREYRMVT